MEKFTRTKDIYEELNDIDDDGSLMTDETPAPNRLDVRLKDIKEGLLGLIKEQFGPRPGADMSNLIDKFVEDVKAIKVREYAEDDKKFRDAHGGKSYRDYVVAQMDKYGL